MRKLFILVLVLLSVIVLSSSISCADKNLSLYYNGKTYDLQKDVVVRNGEYFLEADELAQILGLKLSVDSSHKTLTINGGQSVSTYSINSFDYSIVPLENQHHNTPELINQILYFPFEFIEEKYDLIIKYDKESGSIYFLPDRDLKTFSNVTKGYSLDIPVHVNLDLSGPSDKFDDNAVVFVDNNKEFTYMISCDNVDITSIKGMRLILNDYASSDEQIFKEIAEYTKSYFRAMQELYKNDFLFNGTDSEFSESNIKIFEDYEDTVYGQPSSVVLYNTIKNDRFSEEEETHISITVPIYSKMSIYTINITGKRGFLKQKNIDKIMSLINALKIKSLPKTKNTLKLFSDSKTLNSTNSGIYPDLNQTDITYNKYENPRHNYGIYYPSTFIPYLQNSIINTLDYKSFKIDYNNYFSISVENIQTPDESITEKIYLLKSSLTGRMDAVEEGNLLLSGKEFSYLKYEINQGSYTCYIQKYYIVNDAKLYTIELNSRFTKPSKKILEEFLKIVKSIEFKGPEDTYYYSTTTLKQFLNEQEGYSFYYPENWEVLNKSQDINFDRLSIVSPDYSGPLDIYVNESAFLINAPSEELLMLLTSDNTNDLSEYIKNYYAPYSQKPSKVLNTSSKVENGIIYIYRLINFLDDGDRHKLCYSVDIIRDSKIYSMFVSSSDYLSFTDGSLSDKELDYIVNFITNSFTLEDTKEYLKRKSTGETRNRKIVFLESCFKIILGNSTTITRARYVDSNEDVLIHISKSREAGTYRLKYDYYKKKFEIIDVVLQNDAVNSSKTKLQKMNSDKVIHSIVPDYNTMTITIKFSNNIDSPVVSKSYFIDVLPKRGGFDIRLIRKYTTTELKSECKSYLENRLLTKVDLHFPMGYNYSKESLKKSSYESQIIKVFAKFNNKFGYFLIKIDPSSDSISIIAYASWDEIEKKLINHYNLSKPHISLVNFMPNDSNPFELEVLLSSKSTSAIELDTLTIEFDKNTHDLIFVSR